jgi:hypothetical protein
MLIVRTRIAFIFLTLLPCLTCFANDAIDWSESMRQSIFISPQAVNLKYHNSLDTLKATYQLTACYPAKATLRSTASFMRSKGWERMAYDPFNPHEKLPPDYPSSDQSWDGYYPWHSYWVNKTGDVVTYQYSFDVPYSTSGGSFSPADFDRALRQSCSLRATVAYFSLEAFNRFKKNVLLRREMEEGRRH